jgi:competence protein ComEC
MLMAQAGLTVTMLPVGMLWFQQVTLLGLVSNLLAIPWISFTVVPATLLAVLLLPFETWLTPFLLFSAAESAQWLSRALAWLESAARHGWLMTPRPGLVAAALATAGGLLLILPRGVKFRFLGLLLLIPLLLPAKRSQALFRLEVLDVGQGMAALIETQGHLLLYDSGPGDNRDWSLVPSAIAPAIAQTGKAAPDLAIISHGDLDHAGGLYELRSRYPDMKILANLGRPLEGTSPCREPLSWNWDGVEFEILHPGEGLPYLGNDSSCVVSITAGKHRLLLPGDIGSAVEQRLVSSGLQPYQVLLLPHHGSKSSSSSGFIDATSPGVGLVSAAYRNRFGFPHAGVTARFRAREIPLWNSADCGAIEILFEDGRDLQARTARRHRAAIWRWQPEAVCP